MKKITHIFLLIASFSFGQNLMELDLLRQQQFVNQSSGAVPIIETYTSNYNISSIGEIILTKPTGVEVGDLLLIITYNDNDTNTAQWDNVTNKPSGFEFHTTVGNSSSDAHLALFWRYADGTETATVTTTSTDTRRSSGFYLRISGSLGVNPINVTGVGYAVSNVATAPVYEVTTTTNPTLVLSIVATDGSDVFPFTLSGTGWTEFDTIGGDSAADVGALLATKEMLTPGLTGELSVTTTGATDGQATIQIAIQ